MGTACTCQPEWLRAVTLMDGVIPLNYTNLKEFPCKRLCAQHRALAKIFYVKRNLLQTLPEDLPFHYPSITILYLPSNKISSLPEGIGDLQSLKSLNLCDNIVSELPNRLMSIRELKFLILRHNLITKLPSNLGDLTELETLDVSHNKLEFLPPTIGKCTKIDQLLASHNQLTFLPRQICKLKRLEQLSVSSNQLLYLPVDLGKLQTQTIFEFENNPMLHYAPLHIHQNSPHCEGCSHVPISESLSNRYALHHVRLGMLEENDSAEFNLPNYGESCLLKSGVASLLEIASRAVHNSVGHGFLGLNQKELPYEIYNRLKEPVGHCYQCYSPMFWTCLVRLDKKITLSSSRPFAQPNAFYFVSYFCSQFCALQL